MIMFGLIKKIFIGLLTGLVNGSNHTNITIKKIFVFFFYIYKNGK